MSLCSEPKAFSDNVMGANCRNLLGEDLGPLNVKELDQLERQLESSLRQIRSTKTQSMLDQLTELQNKEHALVEANKALKVELDRILMKESQLRQSWDANNEQNVAYSHQQHAQSQGLFQPLGCNPNLQIGSNPKTSDQMTVATTHDQMLFILNFVAVIAHLKIWAYGLQQQFS